jgi:hypothetical protein
MARKKAKNKIVYFFSQIEMKKARFSLKKVRFGLKKANMASLVNTLYH